MAHARAAEVVAIRVSKALHLHQDPLVLDDKEAVLYCSAKSSSMVYLVAPLVSHPSSPDPGGWSESSGTCR